MDREVSGSALLTQVRTGENAGFDRVVFTFAGGEIPAYHVEYVDRPARACGSGREVRMGGDGWLLVRFIPADAHDQEGRSTIEDRERSPHLPVLRELRIICDFEAHVEWLLAVSSPNRYRVLELRDPSRLVVDIRH